MPSPRMSTYVAQQAGREPLPLEAQVGGSSASPGEWIAGTVSAVQGFINASYMVDLDSGQTVSASDTGDGGLSVGSRVWVVMASGGDALIVGYQ
jgi:hypothetical protein